MTVEGTESGPPEGTSPLSAVPHDSDEIEIRVSRHQLEQWTSPFIPARELQRLGEVVNDGAERAFQYAEREQAHRIAMDDRNAKRLELADSREYRLSWAGMWFAFALATIAIIAGVISGLKDQPVVGSILGGGGLVLIVVAFLRRPK